MREKCQRFLTSQLPGREAEVARAAGTVPTMNGASAATDMDLDHPQPSTGNNRSLPATLPMLCSKSDATNVDGHASYERFARVCDRSQSYVF